MTGKTVEVRLLGMPQIVYDGAPIVFERRKALALLAYLVTTEQQHSRDALAEFLYPENDSVRSRGGLRRVLAAINETPLGQWIDASRDSISIKSDDALFVDIQQFNRLIAQGTPESLSQAVDLYKDTFLAGFTLKDSAAFDDWQSTTTQELQQNVFAALEKLSEYYGRTAQHDRTAAILRRWIALDPLQEFAHHRLIQLYATTGQRTAALDLYGQYERRLDVELGVSPSPELKALIDDLRTETAPLSVAPTIKGSLPPLPALVIGREAALAELKRHLIDNATPSVIVQGWPGIGKTTVSATLAHDSAIQRHYVDGILWTSLGQTPNLLAVLVGWGRALGFFEIERAQDISEASARLTAFLKDQRVLLIIDDVWSVDHAMPLRVGGANAGLLMTTRLNDVAFAFASQPESLYKIPILTETESVRLLDTLAPEVVRQYPTESAELARDLEGLPLALQVAGRLLNAEIAFGWGIIDLLNDLREGRRLLEAQAPADRSEIANQITPTIAALLQRSIERLTPEMQERFALLGVFAPKPATFTVSAIAAVWDITDVRASVRLLVERGLLEPAPNGHFQMHALLVMLAKSMFEGVT